MQVKSEMQQGWEFAARIMGTDVATHIGKEYVEAVEAAIKQLEGNVNNHMYRNLGIKQLQGYMLEEWGAGTFNVDAVAADSIERASVLHSTAKDSVDIQLSSGEAYSAKSYTTAEMTAKAQAKLNPETGKASYYGQERLVPSDQLLDAKAAAHREALRNQSIRSNVSDAYAETESRLTDTIKNEEGISSRSVSRKELEKIAQESKEQKFEAKEHDITLDSAIKTEYMLKQALKAGYTTAAITAAFQLAPEIYEAIDFLVKHGEIDIQQVKRMGIKGLSAGAEGFLCGSVSSFLLMNFEKGVLGEAFKGINPSVLGTVVAVVMQTVKNSILVAAGKMSSQEMGAAFMDTVVISGGYLLGVHIVGIIGQALGFELPVVGYLLGSLIGSSVCAIYNIGKKRLISFCVDTGFTCFGLVEQNYELPDEALHELGIETIPVPRTQVEHIEIPRIQIPTIDIDRTECETIELTTLRRGIIGVNKIGYVM